MTIKDIIFVDLDSTLIQTRSGEKFPQYLNDWTLVDPVVKYVESLLRKRDYLVMIVSNQGGISRGRVSETNFDKKLESVKRHLPFGIDKSFIAKSMNSPYRKPKTENLVSDLNEMGIHYSNKSIMIGDAGGRSTDFSDSDKKFAENLGIKFIHALDIK